MGAAIWQVLLSEANAVPCRRMTLSRSCFFLVGSTAPTILAAVSFTVEAALSKVFTGLAWAITAVLAARLAGRLWLPDRQGDSLWPTDPM